jgi:hypothetical protein
MEFLPRKGTCGLMISSRDLFEFLSQRLSVLLLQDSRGCCAQQCSAAAVGENNYVLQQELLYQVYQLVYCPLSQWCRDVIIPTGGYCIHVSWVDALKVTGAVIIANSLLLRPAELRETNYAKCNIS